MKEEILAQARVSGLFLCSLFLLQYRNKRKQSHGFFPLKTDHASTSFSPGAFPSSWSSAGHSGCPLPAHPPGHPAAHLPSCLAGHCGFKEVCLDYYPHSAEKQDIHIKFNPCKLIFSSLLFQAFCLISEPLTLAYLALLAARFENLVSQRK